MRVLKILFFEFKFDSIYMDCELLELQIVLRSNLLFLFNKFEFRKNIFSSASSSSSSAK